jgi:hypothetical protein
MNKSPQEKPENNSQELPANARAKVVQEIDNITFKNLLVNSLMGIIAGAGLLLLVLRQEQSNWWSLALFLVALILMSGDDLFAWFSWQLKLERSLKQTPANGFWLQLIEGKGRLKAEIGSLNYPERPIWRCQVFQIQTGRKPAAALSATSEVMPSSEDDCLSADPPRIQAKVYMHTEIPVPAAIETEEVFFLVKPQQRISMVVIEFIEHCLRRIFPHS